MKRTNYKKLIVKILIIVISLAVIMAAFVFFIDYYIGSFGSKYLSSVADAPKADAIIVLGAFVRPDGSLSPMLSDRLEVGYQLYKAGKAPKILVSGDHGSVEYDEVNSMRNYLQKKGIPREDIFMDHAGFNTYDSMYRAKDVFLVKKAILVSQKYHVVRALYTARNLGLESYGVSSDLRNYYGIEYYRLRDVGSRFKAFVSAGIFKPRPKLLGDAIPIWKSGTLTDNGK